MSKKQQYLDSEKELRKEYGDAVVNKAIENLEKQQGEKKIKLWCEEEGREGTPMEVKESVANAFLKKKRASVRGKLFFSVPKGVKKVK